MILRTYIKYWFRLVFAHLSNWSFSSLFVPPQTLGFMHAQLDLSRGVVRVYYSGLYPLWHLESEKLLQKDYQIEYINLNHVDHTEWHENYESAFNRVMRKAIRHKYGVDVVELCLAKAEFQFRRNSGPNSLVQNQMSA